MYWESVVCLELLLLMYVCAACKSASTDAVLTNSHMSLTVCYRVLVNHCPLHYP